MLGLDFSGIFHGLSKEVTSELQFAQSTSRSDSFLFGLASHVEPRRVAKKGYEVGYSNRRKEHVAYASKVSGHLKEDEHEPDQVQPYWSR